MKYKNMLLGCAVCVVIGCHGTQKAADNESSVYHVSDTMMNMIAIDTVKLCSVENELSLTGKVSFDEDAVVKVYPLVSGLVGDVKVTTGDYVKKGQVLAIVKSAEAAGIRNDLLNAQANLEIGKKNLSATEDLYKSGISSEREYLSAQSDVRKAESELTRMNDIVKINGNNATADYMITAPVSGYIVERFINPHMQIRTDNSNNLFTISDLKHVWVLANVYETDIAKVNKGDEVTVNTIAYQNVTFKGTVDKLSTVLDPDNKTMKIRINLTNNNYMLKPEMFANVIVKYSCDSIMPAVLSQAVIFDKNKNFVMLYDNGSREVQTREVQVFSVVGEKTYITAGLKPGDRIITKCQLLIYNALNES